MGRGGGGGGGGVGLDQQGTVSALCCIVRLSMSTVIACLHGQLFLVTLQTAVHSECVSKLGRCGTCMLAVAAILGRQWDVILSSSRMPFAQSLIVSCCILSCLKPLYQNTATASAVQAVGCHQGLGVCWGQRKGCPI